MKVAIINTGVANVASIIAAFYRLEIETFFVTNVEQIINSEYLLLPGVGAFESGMRALENSNSILPLIHRINSGMPTLAICLGLQLLCKYSEENKNIIGLNILKDIEVQKFPSSVRVPHFGWNKVYSNDPYFAEGYAYFANSYRITKVPEGWSTAKSVYDSEFISGIKKGRVIAMQFHPELSSIYGEKLLSKWITV